MFSEQELAYLQAQPLARIATVDNDGQPTVVVVGFQFDGARFYISGHQLGTMRKYKLPRDYPSCLLELGYRRAGVRAGPGRPQKNQMAMRNTLVIQSLAGLKK